MITATQAKDQVMQRVMVVDDEPEICQMIALHLDKSGLRTTTLDNVCDAYNLLQQETFDAIVTDVMMPEEDGISFLGRVHQSWPDIPVILMTGYAQLPMAVDAIKKGAFDFVHKPFDFGHMRTIVERAVNYNKLQRMEKNYRAELEETVVRRTLELKNAIAELDGARSALLKSATDKNDFMSTISHEMRTPMNGVVGGLSLLENEISTSKGKEYLEIVQESAASMVSLIDQLLTFGKGIGQRGSAFRGDLISLKADLDAVMARCMPAFIQKGISLTLRSALDVPAMIWTNKEHLNRLLEILLLNALKFTDQGTVVLEVSREECDREKLCFSVIDSGIGIPEGMLERIFDPFVQGDASYTRCHGGVGLGLAVACQNAMILNGKLWAEHAPGGGSSFKFSMSILTP